MSGGNWPRDDDGGFAPETVLVDGSCTACGEPYSREVSKDSSTRQRLCYNCKHYGWIPIIHTMKITHEESAGE